MDDVGSNESADGDGLGRVDTGVVDEALKAGDIEGGVLPSSAELQRLFLRAALRVLIQRRRGREVEGSQIDETPFGESPDQWGLSALKTWRGLAIARPRFLAFMTSTSGFPLGRSWSSSKSDILTRELDHVSDVRVLTSLVDPFAGARLPRWT